MNLLNSLARETSQSTSTKTNSTEVTHSLVVRNTDHRMAPQKRVLEEDYGIKFPAKKVRDESNDDLCLDIQNKGDFHMALKLQELEQGSSDLSPSTVVDENNNVEKEALQLEADAAGTLLHLKARK